MGDEGPRGVVIGVGGVTGETRHVMVGSEARQHQVVLCEFRRDRFIGFVHYELVGFVVKRPPHPRARPA